MMPHLVEIDNTTFKRLVRHAAPENGTPAAMINRALDVFVKHVRPAPSLPERTLPARSELTVNNTPSFTHSQMLKATIDGKIAPAGSWNELLGCMLSELDYQRKVADDVWEICGIDLIEGRRTNNRHYRNVPNRKWFYRYHGANSAFRACHDLAQWLGRTLDLDVSWSFHPAAAYPGQQARIHIAGDSGLLRQAA